MLVKWICDWKMPLKDKTASQLKKLAEIALVAESSFRNVQSARKWDLATFCTFGHFIKIINPRFRNILSPYKVHKSTF